MDPITIDLDAYCRRIGYDGPRAPTLAVLRDTCRLHLAAIPFENIDSLTGIVPELDPGALEGKLVRRRRGGYCFEQNTLMKLALRGFGFEVEALGARVRMDMPDDQMTPRTHVLLRAEVEDRSFVVDVGFGGFTPTGPLLFEPGMEQTTPNERYRIDETDDEFTLSANIANAWKRLYRFNRVEQFPIDHEVNNFYVAAWPRSFFRNALVAAKPAANGRHLLFNDRLTFQHSDGRREEEIIETCEALTAVLVEVFGITVPDPPALSAAFRRIRDAREE